MASTYLLYLISLILLSISQFANCQICYWPNGLDSGYKQCSSNGGACCYYFDDAHHDPCFSNGLCQSLFFGYIYRGACTDSNWGPSCPNVCTNVNDDQVILRFCKPWNAYCCQNASSVTDCCAAGVGFEWNNATWINYEFAPQQDDFTFNLASAYTTVSASTTATQVSSVSSSSTGSSVSTAVTSAAAALASGTTSACSSGGPTNTGTCSNRSTVAIGAGLGVGLGVPLLAALAGLLWLTARRKYEQPRTTVAAASGSSKPELQDYTLAPAPAYNGGNSEGYTADFMGRTELPIETGYGRAELGQGGRP